MRLTACLGSGKVPFVVFSGCFECFSAHWREERTTRSELFEDGFMSPAEQERLCFWGVLFLLNWV